uniref:TRPM8 channel-associated factor homolog n=1 Tax=Erpetoichthys calabaricus TaxID=27687 RepID=A0A8C4TBL6_ERPCA
MDLRSAYKTLVKGVDTFSFTGDAVPCELLLIGPTAFPVAVNDKGQILVATSTYGKGRLVVMGHEVYISENTFGQFLINAITWLCPTSNAVVGVHTKLTFLSSHLRGAGFKVQSVDKFTSNMEVYCMDAYNDSQAGELIQFVKNGGSLLIAGQAWHWACFHKDKDVLQHFPGNTVTSVLGVYFTSHYGEKGEFKVGKEIPSSSILLPWNNNFQKDLDALLHGVTEFSLKSDTVPSSLLVHGQLAFPVLLDDHNQALIAASHYGRGRIVVLSHETYLTHLKKFVCNALHWLGAHKEGKICVQVGQKHLHERLIQEGFSCELSNLKDGINVYCCTSYTDHQAEQIHEFVSEGGGLLIAGQAWMWSYSHHDHDAVAAYPGNKILNKFGISITSSTVDSKVYLAPKGQNIMQSYHFRKALTRFIDQVHRKAHSSPLEPAWLNKFRKDFLSFVKMKATNNAQYYNICEHLKDLIKIRGTTSYPVPYWSSIKPEDKMLLNLLNSFCELPHMQEELFYAKRKIETFPFANVQINGTNKGTTWRSTGMFLHEGYTGQVSVPTAVVGAGWQVQIGCHSDDLNHLDELKRPPVVIRRIPINRDKVSIFNPWGGLIYIIVPKGSELGTVTVMVEGAAHAPYFKLGQSCVADWQKTLHESRSPWAELEADNIILTIPTNKISHITNPEPLLQLWNRITKGIAELAAVPELFPRPERIVADVQISAGWMHAGYPVMIHLESVHCITDVQFMQTNIIWGPLHELGHNQQRPLWEFPPHTAEATCNLWSVYVNEKVLNLPRSKAISELAPNHREERIKKYLKGGARLEDWTVWVCLETYLQLQEGFGWDPFIALFSDYQKMSITGNLDNKSKMNLWAEKFSQQVRKNLVPFFKAWGWPIEEDVSKKLATLPEWKEDPMKAFI